MARSRVSVTLIDSSTGEIEKAVLRKTEKILRSHYKSIAAGMISEWNKIALKNMSRETGQGDTNNMVRSMFSTMRDFPEGSAFNPAVPTYAPSRHKKKGYDKERFGFWTEDDFSTIAAVKKQDIKQWTIDIRVGKFLDSARFATNVMYRNKKNGSITKFVYMDTQKNQNRINKTIFEFTHRSGAIAKQYADRIFGLAGGSIRTVLA